MNYVIGTIALLFIAIICPMLVGYLFRDVMPKRNPVFIYIAGFMAILAIFEAICVPMNFLRVPIKIEFPVMTALLLALCIPGGYRIFKEKGIREFLPAREEIDESEKKRKNVWEIVYLVGFLILLGIQVFCTLYYDMGFWTSDDGVYVTISEAGVHDGYMHMTNVVTGDYVGTIDRQRGVTAIYNYFAYCRYTTGIPTAIIEHTIYAVLLLLMAYGACYLLAESLFEKKEDSYIFLIILSLCYLFGKYTHYSATFRLLGPIWQGKAILAVLVLPFIFYYFPTFIREKMTWKRMLFIVAVSAAAMSMTLGGAFTMALVPGLIAFLYFLQERKLRTIPYFAVGMIVPAIVSLYYLSGV